jgi:UDP-2-acetamido-2,6-beta-L-arabino-hexul-4-ose reductase
MKRILVTGAGGFLGRNLVARLRERSECEVTLFGRHDTEDALRLALASADLIYHLAGVNRPSDPNEFEAGNAVFTEHLCHLLEASGRCPKIIFSSSVQAELRNPYGVSKKRAEDALVRFAAHTGAVVRIYRLKNLFGKWSRPNYNSVVATFCHNIASDLPIVISDPAREIELSYVDDVIAAFCAEIDNPEVRGEAAADIPSYAIRLDDLAGRLQAFRQIKASLVLPDFAHWFNRALYATYLSYVPHGDLLYGLGAKCDARGSLVEFIKQESAGQLFVSRTKPGVTRGNHYHHTKTEKFLVIEGEGLIRMRPLDGVEIAEYRVSGEMPQVVDIPPGYTHSIENIGLSEMITIFWASEVFDPDRPDTYFLPVLTHAENPSPVQI